MSKHATKSVTITAKVGSTLAKKLAKYGKLTSRTKSSVVERILADNIDYELWFVQEVQKGIDQLERGEGIPHEEAMKEIRAYIAAEKQKRRRDQKKAA
jgi:predicted transcriptional regulator